MDTFEMVFGHILDLYLIFKNSKHHLINFSHNFNYLIEFNKVHFFTHYNQNFDLGGYLHSFSLSHCMYDEDSDGVGFLPRQYDFNL